MLYFDGYNWAYKYDPSKYYSLLSKKYKEEAVRSLNANERRKRRIRAKRRQNKTKPEIQEVKETFLTKWDEICRIESEKFRLETDKMLKNFIEEVRTDFNTTFVKHDDVTQILTDASFSESLIFENVEEVFEKEVEQITELSEEVKYDTYDEVTEEIEEIIVFYDHINVIDEENDEIMDVQDDHIDIVGDEIFTMAHCELSVGSSDISFQVNAHPIELNPLVESLIGIIDITANESKSIDDNPDELLAALKDLQTMHVYHDPYSLFCAPSRYVIVDFYSVQGNFNPRISVVFIPTLVFLVGRNYVDILIFDVPRLIFDPGRHDGSFANPYDSRTNPFEEEEYDVNQIWINCLIKTLKHPSLLSLSMLVGCMN